MAFDRKTWLARWRKENPKKYAAQRKREYKARKMCTCKSPGRNPPHLPFCPRAKR